MFAEILTEYGGIDFRHLVTKCLLLPSWALPHLLLQQALYRRLDHPILLEKHMCRRTEASCQQPQEGTGLEAAPPAPVHSLIASS